MNTHRSTQQSTTLNRKYVKRPTLSAATKTRTAPATTSAAVASSKAAALKRRQALAEQMNRERLAKIKPVARPKTVKTNTSPVEKSATTTQNSRISATDKAIEAASKSVKQAEKKRSTTPKMKNRSFFSVKRVALAFACSAVAVAAIAYFVNLSMPDISTRVAAIQTGIDASSPTYVPRGYSLSSIVSEEGKVVMTFSASDTESFTLSQEKSSWDSTALESNYVKEEFVDYSTIRENGLTLYISGSNCAWVNGGKVFVIKDGGANLTKKQLQSIAKSLQ